MGKGLTQSEYDLRERVFMQSLSRRCRQVLAKNYPYKKDRNRLLKDIWEKGVPWVLLAKVSGLSMSQIARIIKAK